MRYRLMATYRGAPYEAGIGPADGAVVLFAACPPPEELGFEPATGHWRKELRLQDVQAVWQSRPVGTFRGDSCIVLDDLGDRLHIGYLGHDAYRAEQLGYWQVDRGVFELVAAREEVTDIVEERTDYQPGPADPDDAPAGYTSDGYAPPSAEPAYSRPTSQPALGYSASLPDRSRALLADSGPLVPPVAERPLPLEKQAMRATEAPLPLEAEAMRAASAASRRDQATGPGSPVGGGSAPQDVRSPAGGSPAPAGSGEVRQAEGPRVPPAGSVLPPAAPVAAGATAVQAGQFSPAGSFAPAGAIPSVGPIVPGAPVASGGPFTDNRPMASGAPVPSGTLIASGGPPSAGPRANGGPTANGGPIADRRPRADRAPAANGTSPATGIAAGNGSLAAADSGFPNGRPAGDSPTATGGFPNGGPTADGRAYPSGRPASGDNSMATGANQNSGSTAGRSANPSGGPAATGSGFANGSSAVSGSGFPAVGPAADSGLSGPAGPSATLALADPAGGGRVTGQGAPASPAGTMRPDAPAGVSGLLGAPVALVAPAPAFRAQPPARPDQGSLPADSLSYPSSPAVAGPASAARAGSTAPVSESPRRRRAGSERMATERIFAELAGLATIPASSYSVGEEIDGAMCLLETPDGYEVFSSAGGARHEVRLFPDEESACFYLFGVLAADAVRTGVLVPGTGRVPAMMSDPADRSLR